MTALTPKQIVKELDKFIVGQNNAKKSVAIALRNRWRRLQLAPEIREDILPKNILMIGPTGVGKTEIARRLAKLDNSPFIKVEATKFTEVGYVGRDVEQIIRDLTEIAIQLIKTDMKKSVTKKSKAQAEEKILDIIVGESASIETRQKFRDKLYSGEFDQKEIDITVSDHNASMASFDVPGIPGAHMGMVNVGDILGKALGVNKTKTKKVLVKDAREILEAEEKDKLIDQEKIVKDAIELVQQRGIVFLDEIDKICAKDSRQGSDVSREGVQRDLLPLIEGTIVSTKYGPVTTDHILFIASGAFHLSKPSDLLPELQGRLPIRVDLKPLEKDDFMRILTEPKNNLIKQYKSLLSTEEIKLNIDVSAIEEIAFLAEKINNTIENIGARRLHTILEKLLEDISFESDTLADKNINISKSDVIEKIECLTKNDDLSRFIL